MAFILSATEFLCLGLWLGSDVFLSLVVGPGAFRVLGSRVFVGAAGAHSDVCELCGAGGALRGADDCAYGGVAGRG